MKKYVYLVIFLLGFANTSFAEKGINMGLSLQAGVFETSAFEKEDDETSVSKSAEGLFAIGSIFVEKVLPNDRVSFGLDFVPYALESETSNHEQIDIKAGELESSASTVNQTVQVDFENLLTLYAKLNLNENVYLKLGYMQVDAITNETLGTGAQYGDATLDGMTAGLGYNLDLDSGTFVRVEGNWMQLGGETFTATGTDTGNNSVVVDDVDGYGARVSIGKSF
tara:strand:+ start:922 stop:1593 length:672 start_codon:yes stop_codon:yes gene_type:complete